MFVTFTIILYNAFFYLLFDYVYVTFFWFVIVLVKLLKKYSYK